MTFPHGRLLRALAVAASLACASVAPADAADAISLHRAALADKTASVGLPDDWHITKGEQGFIAISGPKGEQISLGVIALGQTAGASAGSDIAITLPYATSLQDKFVAIVHAGATKSGDAPLQITVAAAIPTRIPQCARFLGGWTSGDAGAKKFEALMCSLPPDYRGVYKNLMFLGQVPAELAAQDRPIVEAIAKSYQATPTMFGRMLAPYDTAPPHPSGATAAMPAMNAMPMSPYIDPTNSECFDLGVIRQYANSQLPRRCGGTAPDP